MKIIRVIIDELALDPFLEMVSELMHANLCLQDICYERAAEPVADAVVYSGNVGVS